MSVFILDFKYSLTSTAFQPNSQELMLYQNRVFVLRNKTYNKTTARIICTTNTCSSI